MERREAPGLLARARAPRDPHLPPALGSRKLGVWPGPLIPAEEVSQTSRAPPGAPFLSFGREKENRETGAPGRPKNKVPGQRSVGLTPAILLGQLDAATPFASPARLPATPGTAYRACRRGGCPAPTAHRRWR